MFELALEGCRTEPLASILKGLGAFRLLATQLDPLLRLSWRGEHLVLTGNLTEDRVLDWFMESYSPTPILSPWNGGSGFFANDKAAQKAISELEKSPSPRFDAYREALKTCRAALNKLKLQDKPEPDKQKPALLELLRNTQSDLGLEWLDAACVVGDDGLQMSPLLGTGGNDGRLEFSSNFIQNVVDLLLGASSKRGKNRALLKQALFGVPCPGLQDTAIGQYSPGQAGGPNTTSGFDGKPTVNPWDFVLSLEGSIVFAAAATRRLAEGTLGSTLPFTVSPSLSGHGALSPLEKNSARCEIWIPTWERAVTYRELRLLFSEGRAQTGKRPARNGMDFARAAASLGVERGLKSFVRYSFVVRNGKNYFASPLGRFSLSERREDQRQRVDCLAELDSWMQRYRNRAENSGQSLRALFRAYDDAVFELCRKPEARAFTEVLGSLGQIQAQLASTPKFIDSDAKIDERVEPLPQLSPRWLSLIEDVREVRLATAFVSLPDVRSNIEPIKRSKNGFVWDPNSRDAVWSNRPFLQNLNAVMKRRYLASPSRGDQQLSGLALQRWRVGPTSNLPIGDVEAFLLGDCDEEKISQWVRGLLLVRLTKSESGVERQRTESLRLPLIYALFKTVYAPLDPREVLSEAGEQGHSNEWLAPYQPVSLLSSGQSVAAISAATRFLTGRNCRLRFREFESLCNGPRVSASLMFPLNWSAHQALRERTIVNQSNKGEKE